MGNRSLKHTAKYDSHDSNYVRPLQCKALGLSWCTPWHDWKKRPP